MNAMTTALPALSNLSPAVAIHLTAAVLATALGSVGTSQPGTAPRLTVIQASHGSQIHMVPVGDVLYLRPQTNTSACSRQVPNTSSAPAQRAGRPAGPAGILASAPQHLVRASAIATVVRDESGKLHLNLHGRPERLAVSRLYAHLFKAM